MKKVKVLAILLSISCSAFSQVKRDTIYVDRPDIIVKVLVPTKIIVDKDLLTTTDSSANWLIVPPYPAIISSHIYNRHRWIEYKKGYFRKVKITL